MMKHNKFASGGKTVFLAIVLSLGLSYVYAWTAPTERPPDGNTAAPINTSANAQTKTGTLSVTDIGINGNFIDTITTIPETPAGGAAAIAGNKWPNFADVAGNAARLGGLLPSDILSADTTGTGGTAQNTLIFWSGTATCPTGWTKAFSGKIMRFYHSTSYPILVNGINNMNNLPATTLIQTCGDSNNTSFDGNIFTNTSCTVCAR